MIMRDKPGSGGKMVNYISLLSKVFHGAKRNIMKFCANEHVFSTARVGLSEATGVVLVIYQD